MKQKLFFCAFALLCIGAFTGCSESQSKEMTMYVEPVSAHAGDKSVPVSVSVKNNRGFAATGVQLFYDPALKPVKTGETSQISAIPFAKYQLGEQYKDFMSTCMVGEEKHIVAFSAMHTENCTVDGTLFTVYFDIPDDAKAGTQYAFQCNVDSMTDSTQQKMEIQTENAFLTIE